MRRGILRGPQARIAIPHRHFVSADDLSKLRIDRTLAPIQSRRRRKWWWLAALVVVAAGGAAWFVFSPRVGVGADHAYRHHVSVAAVRRAQFERIRRRPAQGGDLVEGIRPARMARCRRRFARQGGRRHCATRCPRPRSATRKRERQHQGGARGHRAGRSGKSRRCSVAEPHAGSPRAEVRVAIRAGYGEGARRPCSRRRREREGGRRRRRGECPQCAGRRRLHAHTRAVRRHHPVQERERRRHGHAVFVRSGLQGRGRHHGRHEHAGSRGGRVRIQPVEDQLSASQAKSPSTRCPMCVFAARCRASCRQSIAPRQR